jgi:hypothetical protein
MTEDQIKHMVNRFLGWKLPENFSPDDGISFEPIAGKDGPFPFRRTPSGTNLFDATQADAMVRYIIEGLPVAPMTDAMQVKEVLIETRDALLALKKAVEVSQKMNGREYIDLGIQVNNALGHAHEALAAPSPAALDPVTVGAVNAQIIEVANWGAKKLNEVDSAFVTSGVAGAINSAKERFWLIARIAKGSVTSTDEAKP